MLCNLKDYKTLLVLNLALKRRRKFVQKQIFHTYNTILINPNEVLCLTDVRTPNTPLIKNKQGCADQHLAPVCL